MNMLELAWAYGVVFVLAALPFFEGYGVIALAIIAGLPQIPVILIALFGNILTVLLLILFMNKIREWRRKRKGDEAEKESSKKAIRAQKIWKRYGLPGLAIIGPLIVGSHLTAFMCLTLGGTKKSTSIWMVMSIVIWGLAFAGLTHLGVDFLGYEDKGFFKDLISND
ncbi:putative membrane protein [Bacillus mesophilus]|uniref:Small multi-drug export protein n=1 Tax=Bacillus mesophilus TaxID=1808955 RepID=A0A6M0Q3S0_9BACI|nr:small multi-drug export protein [Bacillus mesophilus]MBM7660345.1 putative membrane protein [Bacillus mesophilus]NEY71056.1 small multi-drug export protein [Bacillus mesophilus]